MLVGVPLLFELVFVAMLTLMLAQAEKEAQRVEHSKAIITKANILTKLIIEAGGALAGYSLHKNSVYAEHFEAASEEIPLEMADLKKLSGENPRQEESLLKIQASVEKGLGLINQIKQVLDKRVPEQDRAQTNTSQTKSRESNSSQTKSTQSTSQQLFKDLQKLSDELESELNHFVEDERRLEKSSPQMEQRARQMVHSLLWLGTSLNVLLSLLMAHLFYTGITGRLKILTDNAIRLARNEELNPSIAGSDEVAYLDRVFHEMASALADAASKERSVIENALDVICSIDENGKFTAVSPASVQVWGYQPEELIGRRFTDLILTEDIENTLDCTRRIMIEHALVPFENRVVRKNGSVVQILWSAYWSNSERCMFCVAHDITDRKRAEDLLKESELRTRSIIESMPVGLIIMSDLGQIELVNPQMEKMFGMHASELIGRHVSELFPKAEEFLLQNFKAGVHHRLVGRVREFNALRKSGELFPAELTFIIFNTSEGSRFLVNILDVTERHSVEKLKREFVTTVSHELRTPLTSIRGSLTLLAVGALGPLQEQSMKAVKIAERNALRLVSLINDLLDIEKLEAGKMDMVFEQVNLSTVFERALESVRPYADQYEIKLELETQGEFEVCADADRIVQVVINLLSNACKYSPRNEQVLMSAEADGDNIKITIADKGRGIPQDTSMRIFERFQQVEAADAKRKGGTGLGLAICKAIVEQHNGQIGVESEYGKGSRFWFLLPRWGSSLAPQVTEQLDELPNPDQYAKMAESDNSSAQSLKSSQEPHLKSSG